MTDKPFRTKEALAYGFEKAKAHLGFYVPALLIFAVISVSLGSLQDAARDTSMLAYVLFECIGVIVSSIIAIGFFNTALRISDGQPATFANFFDRNQLFFMYLIASFFYALIIVGGIFLLVVPGIIWFVRFRFFGYIIIDREQKPLAALRESLAITRGHTGQLIVFFLATLGVNIIGALALGVGLLITVPTSMIATAYVYKRLVRSAKTMPVKQSEGIL